MRYLRVKKWETFQHYKDRLPPWIKLHRALLDDYDFTHLPDESKAHLMLIWLLASHTDGRVPNDPKWIAEKIGAKKRVDLTILVQAGWLIPEQDASATLAEREQAASDPPAQCQQDDSAALASRVPPRSRETETYKASEAETEKTTRATRPDLPPWLPRAAWTDFCDYRRSRKGWTAKAEALCLRELTKLHEAGNDATAVIERSIASGWTGLFPLPGREVQRGRPANRSEQRARNMDILTGKARDERTVEGTAERVGGAVVLPLPSDLREPGHDDVGGSGPARSAASVG